MIPTQSCCYQVSLVSESYSAHAVMASKGTHLPNSRARHGSRPCASTSQVPRRAVITSAVDGAVRRFCILLPITGTDFLSFCCLSTPSCPAPAARTCSHTQPAAQRESRLNCLACAARPSSSSSYSSSVQNIRAMDTTKYTDLCSRLFHCPLSLCCGSFFHLLSTCRLLLQLFVVDLFASVSPESLRSSPSECGHPLPSACCR